MASYNTRSGISPDENKLPFTITTNMVEDYLQNKIDLVINEMNKAGQRQESAQVMVYTTEAGKNFLPFIVLLPLNILENEGKSNRNESEPAIFSPRSESKNSGRIKNPIYLLLKAYSYDQKDINGFSGADWKRFMGVSSESVAKVKSLATPKITSFDNGRYRKITLMLDPIRIFHDMLVSPSDNRDFKIDIKDWQKIKTGEYRYNLYRVIPKKNKKSYDDIFRQEVQAQMRRGN